MSKIQVQFSPNEQKMLDACRGTKTIAETVRDALKFYDWCRRAMAEGWTIVATRPYSGPLGKQTKEPLLPFPKKDE